MKPSYENQIQHIASYLPVGYLYLLLIGIASDTMYYGLLGVNIISYSTVLDVLLSPITRMADSLVFTGLILGVLPFSVFYLKFIKWVSKKSGKNPEDSAIGKLPLGVQILSLAGFMIFAAYIGYGFGGGSAKKAQMETGALKPNAMIEFQSGTQVSAHMIGNNSGFVFYVVENDSTVTVSPLQANVQRISKVE